MAFLIPQIERIAGAESQMVSLAYGMRQRGWRVAVIALSGEGGYCGPQLEQTGIEFLRLRMRHGLLNRAGWKHLHHWLQSCRPDVLHAHLPHAAWMARFSQLFVDVPMVIDSIHSAHTGSLTRRVLYRWSDSLTDLVTAVSPSAAHTHASARMVDRDHLRIVPNGINLSRWHPDPAERRHMRRLLGITREFLWIAVGRLELVKNYSSLLRAFRYLPVESSLIIVGDGPLRDGLLRQLVPLGLQGRVHFLGHQADVLPWMQAADALVLPSACEGLPTVLLEAGACCLPAVGAPVPGTRDVLLDGKTGVLAANPHPEGLARAMLALQSMPTEAREALGRNAREHIAHHFSMPRILDQWESIYAQGLSAVHVQAVSTDSLPQRAEPVTPLRRSLSHQLRRW